METQFNSKPVVATLAISVLLASSGTSMANVMLPAISDAFGVSFASARWVVLGYLISILSFSLVVGRLTDEWGRAKLLAIGALVFFVGSLVGALSPSFSLLVFARIVQGLGGAALAVLPIAIANEMVPRESLGRMLGLLASMSAVGTASGPSIGGFLLAHLGWRSSFVFLSALAMIAVVLVMWFLPVSKTATKATQANRVGDFRFVLNHSSLRFLLLSNFFISVIMMSTLITGPYFLANGLHLDADAMGLVMSVGPITSMLSGMISGQIVDRFGAPVVIKYGFMQLLVGALSFAWFAPYAGVVGFAISAALLSFGYQLSLAANSVRIMNVITSGQRGLIAGALNLMRYLGLICGAYFMGGVFDSFSKSSAATGLEATFAVAALLVTILLAVHLRFHQERKNGTRFADPVH